MGEGRWTVYVCTGCGLPTGRHKDCDALREATPVVPCNDAAIARAAQALYEMSRGRKWPGRVGGVDVYHVGARVVAETVLRAAAEPRSGVESEEADA